MSKTILGQVDGFTPVIDAMVADVGLISAAVFGKAWRYCQMSDGVCKAAQDRIADELGLSRATINTHLSKLVEAGYLEDTTPELLGLPHQYRDTGKANLSISLTGGVKNFDTPPVKNIDTKKEDLKKEKEKRDSDAEIFTKLSELTGGGLNSNTPKFVDAWLERHLPARILEAIQMAKDNNARSTNYVDKILLSWEANGYPKTRDEQIAERKAKRPASAYQQIQKILKERNAQNVNI